MQWYALDKVVMVGAVLAFSNLLHRGGMATGQPWAVATLSDQTTVSYNPRDTHFRQALDQLQKLLPVSGWVLSG